MNTATMPTQYATYGSRRIDRNTERTRCRDRTRRTKRKTPSKADAADTMLLASKGNGRNRTVTTASGVFAGFDMLGGENDEPASVVRPSALASVALTVSWLSDGTPKNSAVDPARTVPTRSRTPKSTMRRMEDFPLGRRDFPTSPASAIPQKAVNATWGRSSIAPPSPRATVSTPTGMPPVIARATPYD